MFPAQRGSMRRSRGLTLIFFITTAGCAFDSSDAGSTTGEESVEQVSSADQTETWQVMNPSASLAARSIAAGPNGDAWMVGRAPSVPGLPDAPIFHAPDGLTWGQVAGAAVKVAVSPSGTPWVLNASGALYQQVNGAWTVMNAGLCLSDVAVGAKTYAIGCAPATGDKSIYTLTPTNTWAFVASDALKAVKIAASANGAVYALDKSGKLHQLADGDWEDAGAGRCLGAIAAGPNALLATGCGAATADAPLYYKVGSGVWTALTGAGVNVAVSPDDTPWILNAAGQVSKGIVPCGGSEQIACARGCSPGFDVFNGRCVDIPFPLVAGAAPEGPVLSGLPAHSAEEANAGFDRRARDFLKFDACTTSDLRPALWNGVKPEQTGEHASLAALAMVAYDGTCTIKGAPETRAQRIALVNDFLTKYNEEGRQTGTSIDKPAAVARKGELDAAVKDLFPLLFRYQRLLSPAARANLEGLLQRQFAGRADSPDHPWNSLWFDSLDTLGWAALLGLFVPSPEAVLTLLNVKGVEIEETENHEYMEKSGQYLINQILHERDSDPNHDNAKNGMRDAWLKDLHDILKNDFQEFNSHPYARYSLGAIENLAEFASDPDVATAARAVLDYSAAKFAASSSLGRRSAPFRRRRSEKHPEFFGKGMDEEECRFMLYAGPTELAHAGLPSTGDPLHTAAPFSCHTVARQAAGSYRVPNIVLTTFFNRANATSFQTFAGGVKESFHYIPGGVEIYANDGPFTIAAGGIPVASGLKAIVHLRVGSNMDIYGTTDDDKGVVVDTVLMPNVFYPDIPQSNGTFIRDPRNGMSRDDLVRIVGRGDDSANTCVAPGFACGVNLVVPPAICTQSAAAMYRSDASFHRADGDTTNCWEGHWAFLDFGKFYVAAWRESATTNTPMRGGFFEAVLASRFPSFGDFRSKVLALNGGVGGGAAAAHTVDAKDGDKGVRISTLDVSYNSIRGKIAAHVDYSKPRDYPITQLGNATLPAANTDLWPLATRVSGTNGVTSGDYYSTPTSNGHDGLVTVFDAATDSACILNLVDIQHPYRQQCTSGPVRETPPAFTKDFNGDGSDDLLWYERTTGVLGTWILDGTTNVVKRMDLARTIPHILGRLGEPIGPQVMGTGDFNGDGRSDVLLYDQGTGVVSYWIMDSFGNVVGTQELSQKRLGTLGFTIKGTGDFNNDGYLDVLWYNATTGNVAAWLLDGAGTVISGLETLQTAPASSGWALVGTGDFNGDHNVDLLWANWGTGVVGAWLLNGLNMTVMGYPNIGPTFPVNQGWGLEGTGDYNHDGQTDLLWYNSRTGVVGTWYLNGTALGSPANFSWNVPNSPWQLVSR